MNRTGLFFSILTALSLVSCAAGPTPERVGFDYPEAGIRFSPRRHVVSRVMGAEVTPLHPEAFKLLFQRVTSSVESPYKRLLFTGIVGERSEKVMPLFDELSYSYYGITKEYNFTLTDEREIELPWPGLLSKSGTLRIFHMTPVEGTSGTPQYTFAVTVFHYGNTIEVCWREARDVAPDQQKIDDFFYWTSGLRFLEPEVPEPQESAP